MIVFSLPDEDEELLTANFPSQWGKCTEGTKRGIIISEYRLPDGIYTRDKSDLMLIIPTDYPVGMIDMFYFDPALSRKNGKPIAALVCETHFERNWQRWSRHYIWEPGIHSIISHVSYVQN